MLRSSCSACSRGMRLMRPTIPGMAALLGALHAGESFCVPEAADFAISRSDGFGDPVKNAVVKAQAQGHASSERQRHVVPGQLDLLEAVVPLEIRQSIALLVAIGEIGVPKVRNAAIGAGANGLGNQRIGWSLIPVARHGKNMHEARLLPLFIGDKFDEANPGTFEESVDKDAAIEDGGLHFAQALEVNTVVPKAPALADRRLAVKCGYPPKKFVIERYLPDDRAIFRGFANLVPDLEINLMGHPIVKGGNGKDSHVVPFHGIAKMRRSVRDLLNEGEDVNSRMGFPEDSQGRFGILVDRKSTRLNSSHMSISYAVFCLKKKRIR